MNNLQLITTEKFCDVDCNFYKNENNEVLLTREQIGQALEYSDPAKAIRKIHLKHKDRLEPLCLRLKLSSTQFGDDLTPHFGANLSKSEEQERVYYTQRGVMELCRWSRQPLANKFMDWTWDVIEQYRNNQFNVLSHQTVTMSDLQLLTDTVQSLKQEISELKSCFTFVAKNTTTSKSPTSIKNSVWFNEMNPKYKSIIAAKKCTRNELYSSIYTEIERKCHVNLNRLRIDYCMNNNLSTNEYYLMDLIEDTPEFKKTTEIYIDELIKHYCHSKR